MAEKIKLTIDRQKWYRGKIQGSMLLRDDGRMCCLGFACLAKGVPREQILHRGTPSVIGPSGDSILSYENSYCSLWGWWDEGDHYTGAIDANDSADIPEGQRERLVKEHLSPRGS